MWVQKVWVCVLCVTVSVAGCVALVRAQQTEQPLNFSQRLAAWMTQAKYDDRASRIADALEAIASVECRAAMTVQCYKFRKDNHNP